MTPRAHTAPSTFCRSRQATQKAQGRGATAGEERTKTRLVAQTNRNAPRGRCLLRTQ
mgnify:CR=1 FL=1